jgi:o-succinylbenzoate synthase
VKIRAARVTCFRLPLVTPLATAHGVIAARDGALLEIATRDGLRGFGEALPLPGFGLETFEQSQRALAAIARALLGCDVREVAAALARVQEVAPRAPAARAAADCALHDLAAREAGVSLASLLAKGKAVRTSVRANALVAEGEPGAAALAAQRLAAAGYDTLKLKVGVDLERDVQRIAAVRAALPLPMRIRLDVNGAFGDREAEAALARFARFEPEFVEQPLATHDSKSWARLRAASPVPIAADESVRDEASARALLEAGAVDWLVLKPAALGGVAVAWRIAELARASGVQVAVTAFLDSAIGRMAALQLAAALPGATAAAGLATGSLLADDLANIRDGASLAVPAAAGLGVIPDPVALARCRSGASLELAA